MALLNDYMSDNLIPDGWTRVDSGPVLAGDKYWSPEHLAFLPVTVNSGCPPVMDYVIVIRKRK